ncbi:hypothetical protein [Vibrio ulleungensis]|uniref:Uncharacterized protein n=1 Tax=Vibrio ulleungensis TaxID=2807619 RepID=A0ABS2HDE5_9VIBR|nr:hypothetical protein [Vibrio ulleungensis]MBM7035064.1 hypothetical protein [Vibrio ulleungensis]
MRVLPKRRHLIKTALLSSAMALSVDALASTEVNSSLDYAQVVFVKATQSSSGSWCFEATVRHDDQGWEHYADGWEVVDRSNRPIAFRELMHPHDNEQPFTRSQCGITLDDEAIVTVRAKCNQHGYGGKSVEVDLSQHRGVDFEVVR